METAVLERSVMRRKVVAVIHGLAQAIQSEGISAGCGGPAILYRIR